MHFCIHAGYWYRPLLCPESTSSKTTVENIKMSKFKRLLGKRIRHFRKKNDLSQEKFAELIGIDPNSVSRIECGVHFPSLDTLERISTVLKVEMRDLFIFNNKETAEEMRTFLVQTAAEVGVDKLREVVRVVRKIVNN